MKYEVFNRINVVEALEENGYYIYMNTSQLARDEASRLCDELSDFFNEINESDEKSVEILNEEISPACNLGVIYRGDKISPLINIEGINDKEVLKIELDKLFKSNKLNKIQWFIIILIQ